MSDEHKTESFHSFASFFLTEEKLLFAFFWQLQTRAVSLLGKACLWSYALFCANIVENLKSRVKLRMLELLCFYLCLSFAKKNDALILTAAQEKFVESSNSFALRVYRHLSASEGNIFFCPLCLSSSLSFLLECSAGRTRFELNNTLEYKDSKLSKETVRTAFTKLTERTREKASFGSAANGLFLQENNDFDPDFDDDLHEVYNTDIKMVDFEGNPQKTAWDLNEWVKQKTKSKIKRVVERLDPKNSMLLTNVAYLRTEFSGLFPLKMVKRGRFRNHGIGDHLINVTMLTLKGRLQKLATSYDFRALELPLGGANMTSIKIWILLPHRVDSLQDTEDGLRTSTFTQLAKSFKEHRVDVKLPKARIEYTGDFTKALQEMGIKRAFSAEEADFSHLGAKSSLHLTSFLHKAIIDITESRSEESTQSPFSDEFENVTKADNPVISQFIANHPFLFFVMDVSNGLILHMGRLLEF